MSIAFRAAAPLSIVLPVEPVEWVHILSTGSWKGYHQGPLTIVPEDLRDIVANFKAGWRNPVPFDYEHQSVFTRENGQPAPASGWGTELELREDDNQLWCRTDWTPRAADGIKNQEYRFVSSTPCWGARDPRSGKVLRCVLHSVALTNHPFLRELPAVGLSDLMPTEGKLMDFRLMLLSLLLLPTTATDADISAATDAHKQGRKQLATALGLPESAPLADLQAKAQAQKLPLDIGAFVLERCKVPEGATKEVALATVQPVLEHAGFVPAAELTTLRGELATQKADQLLARALSEGKVTPATEGWFRAWALRSLPEATAWLSHAPKVFPGPADPRTDPGKTVQLSADEAAVARAFNLTPEQYIKGRS